MNSRSTNLSTNENQKEFDILEEQFMQSSCKVEDIPLPKKQLDGFEFEIREIMKSGCNRQIAEYSLMQYKNNTSKNEYSKYEKAKEELIDEINTKLGNKIEETIINTENKDLVEKEIDYEEIIDEILEKNEKNISENNDRYQVKNGLIKLISESKDINLKAFRISKDEYIKKRKPVIEAALRLVKKIVNNENGEYEKFYKEFYG